MHVIGIIAEYNPFHQGHAYQLRVIREAIRSRFHDEAAIVAVMSGSFTQRGEATVLDKWQRAAASSSSNCPSSSPAAVPRTSRAAACVCCRGSAVSRRFPLARNAPNSRRS